MIERHLSQYKIVLSMIWLYDTYVIIEVVGYIFLIYFYDFFGYCLKLFLVRFISLNFNLVRFTPSNMVQHHQNHQGAKLNVC